MLVRSDYFCSLTRLPIGTDNSYLIIGICDVTVMKILPGMIIYLE